MTTMCFRLIYRHTHKRRMSKIEQQRLIHGNTHKKTPLARSYSHPQHFSLNGCPRGHSQTRITTKFTFVIDVWWWFNKKKTTHYFRPNRRKRKRKVSVPIDGPISLSVNYKCSVFSSTGNSQFHFSIRWLVFSLRACFVGKEWVSKPFFLLLSNWNSWKMRIKEHGQKSHGK